MRILPFRFHRLVRTELFLLVVFFSLVLDCAAAAGGKVERVDRPTDSPVASAVWDVMDSKGYRLSLEDGSTVCDLWLRKNISGSGAKEVEGVLFPEITPSTLLGVISFPKGGADFRGQPIKAGFYNLRYALIPNDGNHLGVSPSRDFALMVPATADPDPAAQFKFEELVNLSKKATGTNHPGPLSMVQADSTVPGLIHDDQDHWVFSVKVPVGSEEIPIGLIIKGTAQQ